MTQQPHFTALVCEVDVGTAPLNHSLTALLTHYCQNEETSKTVATLALVHGRQLASTQAELM